MPRHDLKDEAVYEREKAEQHLWEAARTAGISRRRFLQLIGAGFVVSTLPGGLLTACANDKATKEEVATEEKVIKPTSSDYFYVHNGNREMRWEAMADQGYYTPNWLFFVRNHTSTPRDIDVSSWRLGIEGSGVENPTEFTYDDLLGMEEVSLTTAIECAGNGRSFFDLFQGRKVEGTQWKLGAIGIAEWTGVRLRELLERAKVKPTAVDVMPSGLDSEVEDKGHVRRPMPLEKAMDDETLLVYGRVISIMRLWSTRLRWRKAREVMNY
jgi:DMSO/TMAO reductase YedYZ molybdopterin-dependent catalytic subunit